MKQTVSYLKRKGEIYFSFEEKTHLLVRMVVGNFTALRVQFSLVLRPILNLKNVLRSQGNQWKLVTARFAHERHQFPMRVVREIILLS